MGVTSKKVNWILDADIEGFFDTIDHEWMIKFLEHRIGDRRVLRLIRKWLKAGISEDGKRVETKVGTPQGAVISPLLSNVYLHYVFDLWIQWWRETVLPRCVVVRYADDFVIGFENKRGGGGVSGGTPGALRQVRAEAPRWENTSDRVRTLRGDEPEGAWRERPETFDFLGFTHACADPEEAGVSPSSVIRCEADAGDAGRRSG